MEPRRSPTHNTHLSASRRLYLEARERALVREAQAAVDRDPEHDFGVGEVALHVAHFPDGEVGVVAVLDDVCGGLGWREALGWEGLTVNAKRGGKAISETFRCNE